MYTVHGYIDGASYTAIVGGQPSDENPTVGIVSGSSNVVALLDVHEGGAFRFHATSGSVPLRLDDEASILAALSSLTQITSIDGEPPEMTEPDDPTVVY